MEKDIGLFGDFLKKMRKETGLSQLELAQKAGVGLRLIRDIEQGKKSIRLDTLNAVLALFGYCAGPVPIKRDGDT
jgi:y4mF family transcriptional regulator